MNIEPIESERLKLRQWDENDFPIITPHFQNQEFTKFLGGTKDQERIWAMIANYIGHWYLKGYGYWAVVKKSSNKIIGGCGLWNSPNWPEIELGYWILPPYHGKGYASEGATQAKRFAFDTLNLKTLVSYIDPENEQSIKVAKKLGGTYDKTIELSSFGQHDVYRYKK